MQTSPFPLSVDVAINGAAGLRIPSVSVHVPRVLLHAYSHVGLAVDVTTFPSPLTPLELSKHLKDNFF